jgi:hypothetical protein
VSRTIEIQGQQTLEDLHHIIFQALDREEEHMYEFQFGGSGPNDPAARRYGISAGFGDDLGPTKLTGNVTRTTLDVLNLKPDDMFGYWFDFGDDWWHQINVVSIEEEIPAGDNYPRVTKRVGASPPQYAESEMQG